MSLENIIMQVEQKIEENKLTQKDKDRLMVLILEMLNNISRSVNENSTMIQDLSSHLGV